MEDYKIAILSGEDSYKFDHLVISNFNSSKHSKGIIDFILEKPLDQKELKNLLKACQVI
jgi:hypothetical protein